MNDRHLVGVLERIVFLNEENHYTIAEFRPEGARERVIVVGLLPGVQCGETLHMEGEWTRHAQHGAQFRLASFRSELPSSVYGIRKYLGSGLVDGIGPSYAEKIVDAFGTDTFRVLSEESARLREVEGIGPKRAKAIKAAWDGQRAFRELYIFLQTYGVTPAQCVRLIDRYGAEARAVLSTEPYRVAREIDGIGFKTADRIAINLGFANDAAPRLDAGIIYALQTLAEEGHTAATVDDLVTHTATLLETATDLVAARIDALVADKQIVRHDAATQNHDRNSDAGAGAASAVQLPVYDRAEGRIAGALRRLLIVPSGLPPIRIEAALEWAEQKGSISFAPQQRAALRAALSAKVSILTGGPGTGKTTCLRALVEILRAKKVRLHLAAPTGRAAQRLAGTTGGFASTLHRLLKWDPARGRFTADEDQPLATDFLVVDEASMLDARLAAALLAALPSRAHLLLVGDTDQLPSVGAGNVLKDIIASATASGAGLQGCPVTRLEVVYRQKGQSPIVTTAHAINSGDPSPPPSVAQASEVPGWSDLSLVVASTPEECVTQVVRLCTEWVPRHCAWAHPIHDVQVLAPMHRGVAGVANFNTRLQEALNPHGAAVRAGGSEYRSGDKIIQLRNDYDRNLFNGDIGRITSADPAEGKLTVDFDGEVHELSRGGLGDIALAYTISIHKSQGSEYPIVIVPLLKAHFMMLQRNLLYTALTRGKKKVIFVGDPAAFAMAVRNNEARARTTYLRPRLAAPAESAGHPGR